MVHGNLLVDYGISSRNLTVSTFKGDSRGKNLPKITIRSNHLVGEHVHATCVSSPDEKHAGLEQSQTASTREY
jgi:hypothetical protein